MTVFVFSGVILSLRKRKLLEQKLYGTVTHVVYYAEYITETGVGNNEARIVFGTHFSPKLRSSRHRSASRGAARSFRAMLFIAVH